MVFAAIVVLVKFSEMVVLVEVMVLLVFAVVFAEMVVLLAGVLL